MHTQTTGIPLRAEKARKALPDGAGYFHGDMQALDELVARWRKNPDPESTLALCAHLGRAPHSELLREVGNTVEAWHRDNHAVMLSVGCMYLDAGLLAEAQQSFVQAGKLGPSDAAAYRYLGEVLLRRGDAVRGEKALARAIKLGDDGDETRLWHERAVLYSGLQQRRGQSAVAEQVARTAPRRPSVPAPVLSPGDRPAATRTARRSRPPLAAAARPSGPRRSSPPGASRRRASQPPPASAPKSAPQSTLLLGRSPVPAVQPPEHPPSPFLRRQSPSPQEPSARPPHPPSPPPNAAGPAPWPSHSGEPAVARAASPPARFFPESAPPPEPAPEAAPSDPFRGTFPEEPGSSRRATGPGAARPLGPMNGHTPAASSTRAHEEREPSPEEVLLSLAQVGLFEIRGGVLPAWEAPASPAPRRAWVLAGAVIGALGLGLGGYRYAAQVQGERLAQAQEIGARLAGLLDSGSPRDLAASEADFQRLFELDSRSQDAALSWLKNRALYTLVGDEPAPGIESALERARAVGVEEWRLAFGRVASALAHDDLPGAAQVVASWDERAKGDAMYQLLVGAMFERAGNPEALARFTSAAALQPDLELAHLMAARLALLQLGPDQAKPTLDLAYARLGPGAPEQVLRGLAWASAPAGTTPAPPLPNAEALAELAPMMRSTASAVEAVRAYREGRHDQVEAAFQRALGANTAPLLAAWIGYQALDAGNVQIARTAALAAMKLSALHEDSRALAARIALADGRLSEARDAVRGLDPSSGDALLIEAVSAYEGLQSAACERIVAALPENAEGHATLQALRESSKIMLGQSRAKAEAVKRLGNDAQVWGPLIALDLALDTGQLALAEQLIQSHLESAELPSYALRIVRLKRYQGQFDGALEHVRRVLEAKDLTPRGGAEAVLGFVDAGRAAAAASALTQVSPRAGALSPWLEALVESAAGRAKLAAKQTAKLPLPGKGAALLAQTLALRSLVAAKDRRARAYLAELGRRFPAHPEVRLAAEAFRR